MNDITKNIFNKIDSNTYIKIKELQNNFLLNSTLYVSGFAAGIVGYPLAFYIISGGICLSQLLNTYTTYNGCEQYTKEIREIINLYNVFLDNYIKLNNTLELSHPLEIYKLYDFALYNGLLSKNNNFNYNKNDSFEFEYKLGLKVLTGSGVCRHISGLLDDIYNKLNLESCSTSAYIPNKEKMLELLLESMIKNLKYQGSICFDAIELESIDDAIKYTEELYNNIKTKKMPFTHNKPNHVVNLVSSNNVGYIIDPTNKLIYKKEYEFSEKEALSAILIYQNETAIQIDKKLGDNLVKRKILTLPNSSYEEDSIILQNTLELCNSNMDIISRFSIDNRELIDDINSKMIKVRKKVK